MSELLKLLSLLVPSEHLLLYTFYKFMKIFQQYNPYNQICIKCKMSTGERKKKEEERNVERKRSVM